MPEALKASEVNSKTDPSVAKQWDSETPKDQQFDDFYKIADSLKVGLLGTYRPKVGPVHRSMAIAKRRGPDFLFLANKHSRKFEDLEANQEVTVTFQNSSTQDWVSVTGTASVSDNNDPRIKEVWSRSGAVWFGDLGDGVHDSSANDPRMRIVEVKTRYVAYWKSTSTTPGLVKEIVGAMVTGNVPVTGVQREMKEDDIEAERKRSGGA